MLYGFGMHILWTTVDFEQWMIDIYRFLLYLVGYITNNLIQGFLFGNGAGTFFSKMVINHQIWEQTYTVSRVCLDRTTAANKTISKSIGIHPIWEVVYEHKLFSMSDFFEGYFSWKIRNRPKMSLKHMLDFPCSPCFFLGFSHGNTWVICNRLLDGSQDRRPMWTPTDSWCSQLIPRRLGQPSHGDMYTGDEDTNMHIMYTYIYIVCI